MEIPVDDFNFQYLVLKDETGRTIEYDLKKELSVNENNLLQEMLDQPSKYIYWSSLYEKLKYFEESAELKLELVCARLDKEAREVLEKPTKDSVEAYIKRTEDYQRARQQVMSWKHISGKVLRIVKAFEQRKDLLQSYGRQLSDERMYGRGAGSSLGVPHDLTASPFERGG